MRETLNAEAQTARKRVFEVRNMLKLLEREAHLAALKTQLPDEQINTIHVFMADHGIPSTDSDDDEVIDTFLPLASDISSSGDSDSSSSNSQPTIFTTMINRNPRVPDGWQPNHNDDDT